MSSSSIQAAIKAAKELVIKTCTDKDTLSKWLEENQESDHYKFTPDDPKTVCLRPTLSSFQIEQHKVTFCSLKPEHSVCPTPSSPTPSSPTPSSPAPSSPTPSSPTSTSPTPSSDPQSNTNSTLPMSISASMSSCSCSCLVIIILVVMSQRKR